MMRTDTLFSFWGHFFATVSNIENSAFIWLFTHALSLNRYSTHWVIVSLLRAPSPLPFLLFQSLKGQNCCHGATPVLGHKSQPSTSRCSFIGSLTMTMPSSPLIQVEAEERRYTDANIWLLISAMWKKKLKAQNINLTKQIKFERFILEYKMTSSLVESWRSANPCFRTNCGPGYILYFIGQGCYEYWTYIIAQAK